MKATDVTAGLAESNGSLPPGGWLKITCGLYTGISSGPNARYRVCEKLYLYLYLVCCLDSAYVIGIMRRQSPSSTSTSVSSAADLQLTHHQFRWVLFSVHAEPVRRLLARHLHRRLAAADARTPDRDDVGRLAGAMGPIIGWLASVWNHVNRVINKHGSLEPDVTIGLCHASSLLRV